jgi:hypothetical protein
MYCDDIAHTKLNTWRIFIICQLVSTPSVGHRQDILQEHKYIQKLNIIR